MAKWCLIRQSDACRHLFPALLLDMWREQHGLDFHSCFPFFPLAWGRGDGNSENFTVIEPGGMIGLEECACKKGWSLSMNVNWSLLSQLVLLDLLSMATDEASYCSQWSASLWSSAVMSSAPAVPSTFRLLAGDLGSVCGEQQAPELWLSLNIVISTSVVQKRFRSRLSQREKHILASSQGIPLLQ